MVSDPTSEILVDLNCDLGEGYGVWRLTDDHALLTMVSSANIACGFHAGDASIMREMCHYAVANNVRIGAHVGYQDLAGFGRREWGGEVARLAADILYQLGALAAIAQAEGGEVSYVKPHGALYHQALTNREIAEAVVTATRALHSELAMMVMTPSVLATVATEQGVRVIVEAFADRAYASSAALLPRVQPGAVISDAESVANRALDLALGQPITDIKGRSFTLHPDSVCIHSDTPNAVAIVEATHQKLRAHGVQVTSQRTTRPQ
jgi:5-oxoprolinase (ATP-hydrolysing) subunit A